MDDGENTQQQDNAASRHNGDHFRVHHRDSTGTFVEPSDNTWAAHAHYIKNSQGEMHFNTERYSYFDGIIAKKLGIQALTDPNHTDYARYEAMRSNIAVLRNFVLVHYEKSGLLENGTKGRVENIAESLGQALANDKWNTRDFTRSASVDVANIDGVGAMEMYKHLLEMQEAPTTRQALITNLKNFLTMPNRDWKLPSLAESPFSPEALAAPPPGYVSMPLPKPEGNNDTNESDAQLRDIQNQSILLDSMDVISQAIDECEKTIQTVNKLNTVDMMAEAPREESVEEARKILRALRNMEFTDRSIEEFLDQGTPSVIANKKQSFARLVDIFSAHLKNTQNTNPTVAKNPAIQQAIDTSSTIALELAEHTRRQMHEEDEREERLNQLIDSLPKEADLRITQPTERILDTLELGLELAAGREIAISDLERLVMAGEKLEQYEKGLRGLTSEEASREESIAHARAALAHLEQLPFTNTSLQDFIDHGKPKDQAVFAQAVSELASIYRNLLLEAQEHNADILSDPKLKEASDAMSGFGHAIRLMAAKEMPNSIASAQQISAEAAQEPTKWKEMHQHTVDRLVKSADGGLEKALEGIAMEAEEQDEDIAQDIIDSAMQQTDSSKRKKRRRSEPKSRSKKSTKKQRKAQLDMTADDVYLKEGRFAEDSKDIVSQSSSNKRSSKRTDKEAKTQNAFEGEERAQNLSRTNEAEAPVIRNPNATTNRNSPLQNNRNSTGSTRNNQRTNAAPAGLKESDLAAIAKLGGSLRNIGNQIQGLSVTNVTGNNRTQQPQTPEREGNSPPHNPRGQSGPSK